MTNTITTALQTVATVVVSLATKKPSAEMLAEFNKVKESL